MTAKLAYNNKYKPTKEDNKNIKYGLKMLLYSSNIYQQGTFMKS